MNHPAVIFSFGVDFLKCCFQEDIGFSMTLLDIGGGFNGSETQLKQVTIV